MRVATELRHNPGQKVTIFLETLSSDGVRMDGYSGAIVNRVIFPDLSLTLNFPQNMTKLDVGLYYFQFTLPSGSGSIGDYIVDVNYQRPDTGIPVNLLYQVIVSAPFGT